MMDDLRAKLIFRLKKIQPMLVLGIVLTHFQNQNVFFNDIFENLDLVLNHQK